MNGVIVLHNLKHKDLIVCACEVVHGLN